jgi:hypothetical protein
VYTIRRMFRAVGRLAPPVCVVIAAATCGGDSTRPSLPAALSRVGGDGQTGGVGQALPSRLVVKVVDASGTGVQGVPVTWSVAGGGGRVSLSSFKTDLHGLASTTWTLGLVVGPNSATASVAGVAAITPVSFTASAQPGPAAKLAFTVQPSAVTAGAAIAPAVQVVVQDAQGNTVTSAATSITVAIASGTGTTGAVLGGTLTQVAVAGVATFANLTVDKAGTGYSLTVAGTGLTGATSSAFTVSVGAATKLAYTVQPSGVVVGVAISPAVQVVVRDAQGNTVTSAATSVTLAIASGTGTTGAVLGGTLTVAAVSGVATFANLTVDKAGTGYTLTATATSLTSAASTAFNVTPGAATKLAIAVQPSAVAAGAAIAPAVQVVVQDARGNTVTSATTSITVAITSATGTTGAVLGGTLTVAAVNGVATFANLTVDRAGTGYTLTATATSLTGATSSAFTVSAVAGVPATVAIQAGDGQTGLVGYELNVRPAVRVTDVGNAPVAGVSVTFAVASGGGSVTGATVSTNAGGVAQVGSWVIGAAAGGNSLTATVSGVGIAGNPVTFAATGATGTFDITIQNVGPALSPAAQSAFDAAVAKWQRIIYRDIPDFPNFSVAAGTCGSWSPAVGPVNVDDILILVRLDSIDGPGNVLGSAGPCFVRPTSLLTIMGSMRFDTADVATLAAAGQLEQVITHEMGHVLGFGTLWDQTVFNCLQSPSSVGAPVDTYFSCAKGLAMFDSIGGTTYTGGQKVPVENCGSASPASCGEGTINGHWREPVLVNELMTGYLNGGVANPLSRLTAAAMEDLGYGVNYAGADAYVHAFTLRAFGAAAPLLYLGDDIHRGPLYVVDPSGRVVRVIQPGARR